MSNQRHIRKALIEFEESNPHVVKDVLTHSVLVVDEAYSGARKNHFEVAPADKSKSEPQTATAVAEPPKNNLLTRFMTARGL